MYPHSVSPFFPPEPDLAPPPRSRHCAFARIFGNAFGRRIGSGRAFGWLGRLFPALWAPLLAAAAADVRAAETVEFNRDIRPILSNRCFACHGPDKQEAELRLDERESAVLSAIEPGRAAASELIDRITSDDPDRMMPPAAAHRPRLSAREVELLRKWIDAGAAYQPHWAFSPPQRSEPPPVKDQAWSTHPIDRFVLAKLESHGLAPSAPADPRTLLRRMTLDLTGLPPTPEAVLAWAADPSDDAYERAVDRALASPHFGEHQARHWLDVARYADSNGYQYDTDRQQWVWRDWVIHAFNTNLPFDQFTVQQMAGDLLPDATDATRLATGFHRNHPITIEGGVIDEEYRTEYVMDRVVTTSTAWLGLTFLCARCHDHKFDPISQKEFYAFYSYFNNVPERGLNGFAPQAQIDSPLASSERALLDDRLAGLQRRLDEGLTGGGDSLAAWERQLGEPSDQWTLIRPTSAVSQGGATLTALDDGSYRASGANPDQDTLEITFTVGDKPARGLRLEALTDDAFVNKSTGRGSNGNFVLAEFEVAAGAEGEPLRPAAIAAAAADYQQKGYPAAAAIDGRLGRAGWAVDGNTRIAPSTLFVTLAEPIPSGSTVRVRLIHTWGGSHVIGRFRLAAAGPDPPLTPENSAALALSDKQRSLEQRRAVRQFLIRRFGDPAAIALVEELDQVRAARDALAGATPATMILAEMPQPRPAFVLDRGEYDKPRRDEPVTPAVPAALGKLPAGEPANRLGLARWLVAPDNPLTARVAVNRCWAQLFGSGLVQTVEDFGAQGEYPSHPQLLDWLAVEFVESGWDVKHLFKTIVMSRAYRQSSRVTPELHALDRNNRLVGRGPRFRLDAESVRDSALLAGGLLDTRVGGPSVFPYHPQGLWLEINNRPNYSRPYPHSTDAAQLYRRSMYTYWKRTVPPPSMATFDAPEREFCVVRRSRTNTPLQAFATLHDPQFVEAARGLAERMIREGGETLEQRLTFGFEVCVCRPPTSAELAVLTATFQERLVQYGRDPAAARQLLSVGLSPRNESLDAAQHAALMTAARLLLNLSEFLTKG